MNFTRHKTFQFNTLAVIFLLAVSGCGTVKLQSGWADRRMVIDGDPVDRQETIRAFD